MKAHPSRIASAPLALTATRSSTPVARTLVVALASGLGAGTATLALARLSAAQWRLATRPGPLDPSELLIAVILIAATLVAGWLGLGALAAALAALPGAIGRLAGWVADKATPRALRAGVAVMLGAAVTAGVSAPAWADSTPAPSAPRAPVTTATSTHPTSRTTPTTQAPTGTGATTPTSSPEGTPVDAEPADTAVAPPTATSIGVAPDPHFMPGGAPLQPPLTPSSTDAPERPRTDVPAAPAQTARTAPPATPAATVTVRRGDTLWSLAAHRLGPGATPARIAAEWHRWYAANRATIGSDPDRITTGTTLVVPAAAPEAGDR